MIISLILQWMKLRYRKVKRLSNIYPKSFTYLGMGQISYPGSQALGPKLLNAALHYPSGQNGQ